MAAFKREYRNWVEYRQLPDLVERDFHWAKEEQYRGFYENMEQVLTVTLKALQDAQKNGKQYVLLTHGSSTSGPGRLSARSQIRKLMRSKEATPFIVRNRCIQHDSVFVAAIKPLCA